MDASLRIDPGLDPAQIAPVFRRHGRIHLPGFFAGDGATAIHKGLTGPAPWTKSVMIGSDGLDAHMDAYDALDARARAEMNAAMKREAVEGFLYRFDKWRLSNDIEAGVRHGGDLAAVEAVYDFLNGETFLGFIRTLTGDDRPAFCDAMVSRYRAGDFLTAHSDGMEGQNRLYAYVLNFTPVWRPDWGGLLLFFDEDNHVSEGYTPAWNALNLFRVPQSHAVSPVWEFAGADRLSITGWIRARA